MDQRNSVNENHVPVIGNEWKIDAKIGSGGFGVVYRTTSISRRSLAAVKVAKEGIKDSYSEIAWELSVLRKFQNSQHCPRLIDYGIAKEPYYIAMQLLGPSLSKLIRSMNGKVMESGSVASIGRQCLRALCDLHVIGYIHRDIKPSNFSIGRGVNGRKIYLIDFGLCRRYRASNRKLISERPTVGFRGTVKYASYRAHMQKDLSRADDLISLFYMIYEMLTGNLPWSWLSRSSCILKSKYYTPPTQMAENMDKCIVTFAEHIQGLTYESEPEYSLLDSQLYTMMRKGGFTESTPYGWEKLIQPDSVNEDNTSDAVNNANTQAQPLE